MRNSIWKIRFISFIRLQTKQGRTFIVDALTFRLPGITKTEYLDCFITDYLGKIKKNPAAALYPEDGLYLQTDDSERWYEIAGEKGEIFRKEYSIFLQHLINHHAPKEYESAGNFFKENNQFYRSYLSRDLHSASEISLKKETYDILEYLRITFCPQYVVFARLAFLCTHVAKKKLASLLPSPLPFSCEHIMNELLRGVTIPAELDGSDYPYFERLLKAGEITLAEFLDKFQHLGSLDINQPRLGEYSIDELYTIFGQNKNYEHSDDSGDNTTQINADIAALGLEKDTDFWAWCTYAGQFMRLREQAKFELLKILYVLKRTLKESAIRHRFGDLIYYLGYDEALDLNIESREEFRLLALQRKAYFEACREQQVKDVLVDFTATPFIKTQFDRDQDTEKRYKFVTGQSIFYGQAEGICLTAKSNDEYLKKLAAYRVDYIENIIGIFKGVELSYFNLSALAGFTTENGGYLSHAATIAREFRIPYITGIKFDQFQDGDYIILDTENKQVIYRK